LKTSNELEIYDIEYITSKEKFEEICKLKQPTIFQFDSTSLIEYLKLDNIINHFSAFDIQVNNNNNDDTNDNYLPLPISSAIQLFSKSNNYYTDNNLDFINESGLNKTIHSLDELLKPPLMNNYSYDILFGCKNSYTPLSFLLNYRNYLLVTQDNIKIKLIPPKYIKYLHVQYDYEKFQFKSSMNVWDVQPQYKQDYNKIKIMDLTLNTGQCLFIPPYWFYSILFTSSKSSATFFKYKTYANNIAISNHYILHFLQLQNIKHTPPYKKIHIEDDVNSKNIDTTITPEEN
jgi:hypothetical protein